MTPPVPAPWVEETGRFCKPEDFWEHRQGMLPMHHPAFFRQRFGCVQFFILFPSAFPESWADVQGTKGSSPLAQVFVRSPFHGKVVKDPDLRDDKILPITPRSIMCSRPVQGHREGNSPTRFLYFPLFPGCGGTGHIFFRRKVPLLFSPRLISPVEQQVASLEN